MRNERRCFAVKMVKGGKLQIIGFFSTSERDYYCENKENRTRPVTMKQWKEIPNEMKA